MSCERLFLAGVAFACFAGCVQSSGIDPPPERAVNTAVIDGEEVALDGVNVVRGDADEYGPGRRVFVGAIIGDLVINMHIGSFAPGPQDILPFSSPDVGANSGADSEIVHVAVAGKLTVVEGSGAEGEPLEIELEGLILQEACTGARTNVERAIVRGDVVLNDDFVSDPAFDLGPAGHVAAVIQHPELGELPYIGVAGTEKFTRSSGDEVWLVNTGDACASRRFVFTMALGPTDVVDGLIDIAVPGPSAMVLNQANAQGTGFDARSVAEVGLITVDDPLVLDEDGAVVRGTATGLSFTFIDADDQAIPGAAPIEVDELSFRTVMGAP